MGLVFQDKNKVEQIGDRVAIIVYLNKNYEKSFLYKFGNSKYNDLDFSSEHTTELMKNLKTTAENKLKNGEEF